MKKLIVPVNGEKITLNVLNRKLAKGYMKAIRNIQNDPLLVEYNVLTDKKMIDESDKKRIKELEEVQLSTEENLENIFVEIIRVSLSSVKGQEKYAVSNDEAKEKIALDMFDEQFSYEDLTTFSSFALTGKLPKEEAASYSEVIDLT